MQSLTLEWIGKAEGDWATASRSLRARKSPNYDDVCFHSQQCAEKYMKALLQENRIPFSKTNNLITLMKLLRPLDASWALMRSHLDPLNKYTMSYFCPGHTTDRLEAREALKHCKSVRARVRAEFNLPD